MLTSHPMTRRSFVRAAAALTAASASAARVHASDKSGLGPVIVGSGEHTYECIHDWARPPANIVFGNTHGVCIDQDGLAYIAHTVHATSSCPDALCVFDPDGKFVRSWGAEYRGGAHGLTLAREANREFLYHSDFRRGVVKKTTLAGELVLEFPWPADSGVYNNHAEYKPTNVAVVPPAPKDGEGGSELWRRCAGHVYIADGYGKSWVHRYSAHAEYLGTFGGPGAERGQVSCPHGITIDIRGPEPLVLVADRANRRLQTFTLDGRHAGFVTRELRSPCHFDQRDGLLMVPDLEARVTILDRSNELVVHLGDGGDYKLRDQPRDRFISGKFIAPHSACFDKDGNIFVVEWVEVGRVTKLRRV